LFDDVLADHLPPTPLNFFEHLKYSFTFTWHVYHINNWHIRTLGIVFSHVARWNTMLLCSEVCTCPY